MSQNAPVFPATLSERAIYLFEVQLPGWESTISVRGYDENDAIVLARMLFEVPTDKDVTAGHACDEAENILDDPLTFKPSPAGKRGRPSLSINADLICDTLRTTHSVKRTATELRCSRGYIYAALGKEQVRECVA